VCESVPVSVCLCACCGFRLACTACCLHPSRAHKPLRYQARLGLASSPADKPLLAQQPMRRMLALMLAVMAAAWCCALHHYCPASPFLTL
jgi:hypothetical protein